MSPRTVTNGEPEATDAPALHGLRASAGKHRGKLTLVGALAVAGAVPLVLKAAGLRLATVDEKSAAPEASSGGEEGSPPATPTRERVRLLEERAGRVEAAVKATGDEVIALKVEQRAIGVRLDGVRDAVDRVEGTQRAGFDRIADRLDTISDDVRGTRHR